jgi:hypothetical protein
MDLTRKLVSLEIQTSYLLDSIERQAKERADIDKSFVPMLHNFFTKLLKPKDFSAFKEKIRHIHQQMPLPALDAPPSNEICLINIIDQVIQICREMKDVNKLAYTETEGLEIQERIFTTTQKKFKLLQQSYASVPQKNREWSYSPHFEIEEIHIGNAGLPITPGSAAPIPTNQWTYITPAEFLEESLIALEPFCTEFKALSNNQNPANNKRLNKLNDHITSVTVSLTTYARTNNIEPELERAQQQIYEWCGTNYIKIEPIQTSSSLPGHTIKEEEGTIAPPIPGIAEAMNEAIRPEEPSKIFFRNLREIKPLCAEMLSLSHSSETVLLDQVKELFEEIVRRTRQLLQYAKENELSHQITILETVSRWCEELGSDLLLSLSKL